MLNTGASWKASVPIAARGTCPQMSTTGTESAWQSRTGVTELVAPGPGGDEEDADPPARARVAGGHEAGALLGGGDDQADLLVERALLVVAEDRVVGRQDGAAAVAEDRVDPFVGQHLYDRVGADHLVPGQRMLTGSAALFGQRCYPNPVTTSPTSALCDAFPVK